MKKAVGLLLLGGLMVAGGCARPNEIGYTPAYNTHDRLAMIARNWDYEGKQSQDDLDDLLMLRPASHLTIWNVQ
ncbi:MAG TPA: hypothetical protein VHS31_17965 [Tepidisphaeraceae bacterium]|jgi:hypothetical protein|nr:hypothetical protein [Tepidisphaeraceae bacterium]